MPTDAEIRQNESVLWGQRIYVAKIRVSCYRTDRHISVCSWWRVHRETETLKGRVVQINQWRSSFFYGCNRFLWSIYLNFKSVVWVSNLLLYDNFHAETQEHKRRGTWCPKKLVSRMLYLSCLVLKGDCKEKKFSPWEIPLRRRIGVLKSLVQGAWKYFSRSLCLSWLTPSRKGKW